MIKLSIPFTKDNKILSLVKDKHIPYIDEIYMPVPHSIIPSARPYDSDEMAFYEKHIESYIEKAKSLGLKVSLIANKVYIHPNEVRPASLKLVNFLKKLKETHDIDKVVLSNLFIIDQYGQYINDLGIDIELSVLVDIRGADALDQILTSSPHISSVCFADNLIHDINQLAFIREKYPSLNIKLIANHGCMVNCSTATQHHLYSSCTFEKEDGSIAKELNNKQLVLVNNVCKGCTKYLIDNRNLNEISFIRPEDTDIYNGIVDQFKIAGREHDANEIMKTIEAYIHKTHSGSIEHLLDLSVPQIEQMLNENFPQEFGTKRSQCLHQCYKCNYCKIISDFIKSRSNSKENTV